jgi:hypothetical protein
VPVARDPHQLPRILEVLARVKMEPAGDFLSLIGSGSGLLWHTTCVFLAYGEDDACRDIQAYLAMRGLSAVFLLCRTDSHMTGSPLQKIHRMNEVFLI